MNEVGLITITIMFSIRLAVPFGLLLMVGSLANRRQARLV